MLAGCAWERDIFWCGIFQSENLDRSDGEKPPAEINKLQLGDKGLVLVSLMVWVARSHEMSPVVWQ